MQSAAEVTRQTDSESLVLTCYFSFTCFLPNALLKVISFPSYSNFLRAQWQGPAARVCPADPCLKEKIMYCQQTDNIFGFTLNKITFFSLCCVDV